MNDARRLKENLRNEAKKKVRASIHQELQQTRNPNPIRVKVSQNDTMARGCVTKEQVKEAIGGEIDTIFSKADSTQACQGALFGLL